MQKRYMSIWFRHLLTDRWVIHQPDLKDIPFVLADPERGRMVIRAANAAAGLKGIAPGMVVADARAVLPSLLVINEKPGQAQKLLNALAEWCLRYTPVVSADLPDGLVLDITGCAHLWGGERAYLKDVVRRLRAKGYDVRAAIADTIAAAWAVSRYGTISPIVESGEQMNALAPLPPAALRLEPAVLERMHKLGFYQVSAFAGMPPSVLRRRFGQHLLQRINQAMGRAPELLEPIRPVEPYQERLPSLEPIRTATGIHIGLKKLLEVLCSRLAREGKGLRKAVLKCYRIDGKEQQIEIGTSSACCSTGHLFKLFELKVSSIKPGLGIELFILEAPVVDDADKVQETLWNISGTNNRAEIAELLDRLAARGGFGIIKRYLPDEHYWPERSVKVATSLDEMPAACWRTDHPRPVLLLERPELIQVTAPVPDYPPMLFVYQGKVHKIARADGPERIEQEWWIEDGLHRDYYAVEDEQGARYWIFRLGYYDQLTRPDWFVHGFFA